MCARLAVRLRARRKVLEVYYELAVQHDLKMAIINFLLVGLQLAS